MINSRVPCGAGRSSPVSKGYRSLAGASIIKGRENNTGSRIIRMNAISSDSMQAYVARDLSSQELESILARPRIDFSSILDIVRSNCNHLDNSINA